MLLLNFAHPLTAHQNFQVETMAGAPIEEVRLAHMQINQEERLEPQVVALVDNLGLSTEEWQMRPLLVNPPGYTPAAFVLLTELHGRMGHFPSFIRLRPKPGPVPDYEVAELLNLQAVRESARERRFHSLSHCGINLAGFQEHRAFPSQDLLSDLQSMHIE